MDDRGLLFSLVQDWLKVQLDEASSSEALKMGFCFAANTCTIVLRFSLLVNFDRGIGGIGRRCSSWPYVDGLVSMAGYFEELKVGCRTRF